MPHFLDTSVWRQPVVTGVFMMAFVLGLGAPIAAADSAVPNYSRPVGGVLPEGSDFTASSIVRCERPGTGAGLCDAGVVRQGGGSGFVMLFWPDTGSRVLYFEKGEIVGYDQSEADGGAVLSVLREDDVQTVTIGEATFEIVDALLIGG